MAFKNNAFKKACKYATEFEDEDLFPALKEKRISPLLFFILLANIHCVGPYYKLCKKSRLKEEEIINGVIELVVLHSYALIPNQVYLNKLMLLTGEKGSVIKENLSKELKDFSKQRGIYLFENADSHSGFEDLFIKRIQENLKLESSCQETLRELFVLNYNNSKEQLLKTIEAFQKDFPNPDFRDWL